jgi:hypothetical protein
MKNLNETRRQFMTHFASTGLGATLVPGVSWARMQDTAATDGAGTLARSSARLASANCWRCRKRHQDISRHYLKHPTLAEANRLP